MCLGEVVEAVQVNLCLPWRYKALCEPWACVFVLGMEDKVLSIYGHAVVRGFKQGEGWRLQWQAVNAPLSLPVPPRRRKGSKKVNWGYCVVALALDSPLIALVLLIQNECLCMVNGQEWTNRHHQSVSVLAPPCLFSKAILFVILWLELKLVPFHLVLDP